jgi:hypothetical protein
MTDTTPNPKTTDDVEAHGHGRNIAPAEDVEAHSHGQGCDPAEDFDAHGPECGEIIARRPRMGGLRVLWSCATRVLIPDPQYVNTPDGVGSCRQFIDRGT